MRNPNIEDLLFDRIENNYTIAAIESLLKKGINLYATNKDGITPIMLAASIKPQERAKELCKLLLEYGDKAQVCTYVMIDDEYITPVQEAKNVGNEEVAMYLLGQLFND